MLRCYQSFRSSLFISCLSAALRRTLDPEMIKALADFVHSKGLKLGIYLDAGCFTCSKRMPGSLANNCNLKASFIHLAPPSTLEAILFVSMICIYTKSKEA